MYAKMISVHASTTRIVLWSVVLLVLTTAAPNPWSPRLKTFDIWGVDELESPITDQSSAPSDNDDGPEIIGGQYSDTLNQTGSRNGKGIYIYI